MTAGARGQAVSAALRAAALLRGGVPASRVWRLLGEEPTAPIELVRLASRIADGRGTPAALAAGEAPEWRVLAAAWQLAEASGAPLAAVLERLAGALVALDRLAERRAVLLSGPRATIRLVASLPLLSLLLGVLLGFDPFSVLLSPLGAVLVPLGSLLLLLGVRWAARLTDRLASAEWVAGLECELCWVALSGGAAPADALRRVVDCVDGTGAEWVRLSSLRRDAPVHSVLRVAASFGTPAGPLLLAEADAARARSLAQLEHEAERLGVRVLLPIGVCVLPAFIVLGVLPMLFAVLGSMGPVGLLS